MTSIEVKGTARTIAEHSSEQRELKSTRKNTVYLAYLRAGYNVHFTVTNDEVSYSYLHSPFCS
jgi:large subunit ribosomal protein L25